MRRTMLPKLATAAACLMLASCGLFSKEKLQLTGKEFRFWIPKPNCARIMPKGNIKFICHDRM